MNKGLCFLFFLDHSVTRKGVLLCPVVICIFYLSSCPAPKNWAKRAMMAFTQIIFISGL